MTDKERLALLFDRTVAGGVDPSEYSALEIDTVLLLANRIKKYKKKNPEYVKPEVKIAVLGSYSIQHFVTVLDAFLTGTGIQADIYEGEYGGIQMDVLDEKSALYEFNPQIVILLVDDRELQFSTQYFASDDEIENIVNAQLEYFKNLWSKLSTIRGCQILQSNIVVPHITELGKLESGFIFSRTNILKKINLGLTKEHPSNVTIMDMEYQASFYGKKLWFDYSSYFLTKAGFSVDCLPGVAAMFTRSIMAVRGRVKKCLVLDLDNTLWGGVVGDDGYDGIQIDPHNAVGEAYRFFQKYVKELKERGVILAVCSKNDEDKAKEPFEKNPDMILKLSDIACFMANWEDKASNIRNIAAALNIGIDSLVFVDDNPAERQIVRQFVPEVLTIELPEDPSYYAAAIEESDAFSWVSLTAEDIKRSDSYVANNERQALLSSAVNYEEYLKALDMEGTVFTPAGNDLARFTQLINKSNQFNLRTQRYTDGEIEQLSQDDNTRFIAVSLKDRFTSYGIIACVILKKNRSECFIDTWLMSCRVLKRGVEQLTFREVIKAAGEMGCDTIVSEYLPTKKNSMVKHFYDELGFASLGDGKYSLKVQEARFKEIFIS